MIQAMYSRWGANNPRRGGAASPIENVHESIPREQIIQVLSTITRLHLTRLELGVIDGIANNAVNVDNFLVEVWIVHLVRSHKSHRRILRDEGKGIPAIFACGLA